MRVTSVLYNTNKKTSKQKTVSSPVAKAALPQNNALSNTYYAPFQPNFGGIGKLDANIIKKVVGKEYMGRGMFTHNGNYIDCKKIGTELLALENFNIIKATDDEITTYRYALAWAEMYSQGQHGGGTDWVQRYNPDNRNSPLAVSHSLNSEKQKAFFSMNRKILKNMNVNKSLDVPLFNKDGSLFDRIIFDTETTGKEKDASIVQLASMVIKNGKIYKVFNQLINPKIPIPAEATAVHGISDAMVKDAPTILQVISDFSHNHMVKDNGNIVAYNAPYDVPKLNKAILQWRRANLEKIKTDKEDRIMKPKELHKALDPYILIQRIHPFLGAKKKLGYQYNWLFCKSMDNAHDALVDDKGADDVLKYCCYWLEKHRKPGSAPLTVRDVLLFQNGESIDKLSVALHPTKKFNSAVKFNTSYRNLSLNVDNFFDGYKLTKGIISEIEPEIGSVNVAKLYANNVVGEKVDLMQNGHIQAPSETELIEGSDKFETVYYKMQGNMQKLIGYAELEGYNGKTKEEVEALILAKSELYLSEKNIQKWIKNVKIDDIPDGNDLPDIDIAKRVMSEAQERDLSV